MNKAAVAQAGFTPITRAQKRLICNLQSVRKSCGKTRFALTAPPPVGYISVEIGGEEGVTDEFIPSGRESLDSIQIARISMEDPVYPDPADYKLETKDGRRDYDDAISNAVQTVAEPAFAAFYDAYRASLENMRTTVVDTGTDLYQLARLANFGRLEKIPQLAYGQLKRDFAKMVDDAFKKPGHNLIWIHHMKDRGSMVADSNGREKWQASGVYEMDGCMTVLDKVQANIEFWRDDLTEPDAKSGMLVKFNAQIVDSRHNPMAMGQKFVDDNITFADVATAIISSSKRTDWE